MPTSQANPVSFSNTGTLLLLSVGLPYTTIYTTVRTVEDQSTGWPTHSLNTVDAPLIILLNDTLHYSYNKRHNNKCQLNTRSC